MTEKEAPCSNCPRLVTGYRCRASRGRYPTNQSEILWVYTQPESFDVSAGEPGVSGPTYSVMQTALSHLYRQRNDWRGYAIRKTYAAQCVPEIEDDKPRATVLEACSSLVRDVIAETAPQLIVSFGATALKQMGIKDKFTDVRGRVLEPDVTGLPAPLLVTFSERAVTGAPGIFETFLQDLRNGYSRLDRGKGLDVTLEELTANYVLPKTMDEALALVQQILDTPDSTALAVDTETTSLRPEKEGTRVIAFCFSWGLGKATTILFDHPFAPPDYLERLPELEVLIRALLLSPKPKVFHNAKFDLKWIELKLGMPVANVVWCTLLGEHFLDEDKKGNYGLKALTTVWLPKFCGYEDKLHDILEATDIDAFELIDEKIDALGDEYEEYAGALEGFKAELAAYQAAKAEWDPINEAYQDALELYKQQLEEHKAALAAWEALPKKPARPKKPAKLPKGASLEAVTASLAAQQEYDQAYAAWSLWEGPEKPVKTFKRPDRPARLDSAPKEPKDPRSKKEKAYSTDAGFEKVPLHELQLYGGVDGDVTRRLSSMQLQRLANEAAVQGREKSPCRALMASHAIPASRALGEMEYYGTRINQEYIPILEQQFTQIIDETATALAEMAPGVNLNSGPALARLLYDDGWTHPDGTKMQPVRCILQTKKGARSTSVAALAPYVQYDEHGKDKVPKPESLLLDTLFKHKKALKGRDTFLMNFRVLSKRDGKMHTSFNINGTGTGRLSSSDMNLQNTPKYLAGLNIKKLFIPDDPETMVFVNYDYKGAEVRVFTAYAKDPALIKALNEGMDMHSFFAATVFGNPYEDYQQRDNPPLHWAAGYAKQLNTERTQIKRVVFGILYGAGPTKIAEQIGVSMERGKELIELLFTMFPAIRDYIDEVKFLVARDGYVETLFGRRRRFPLQATSRHRSRAERQACNFKIQSTSSDIVIAQLIEIHNIIKSDQTWPEWGIHRPLHTYGVRLLMTVHDSICLQWPKELLHALTPWLTYYGETRVREKFTWLPVPFTGDIEVGNNYGEVMSVKNYLEKYPITVNEELIDEEEALYVLRNDAFEN